MKYGIVLWRGPTNYFIPEPPEDGMIKTSTDKTIRVSIICNVYNHEPYVRAALEGFVKQKANVGYEVLIHDDASTDGSANIIKEYEEKYPDIIKPIYQQHNQFSKNVHIGATYQIARAKGDYIAACEGDDYWIDEYKLQKQFDYMEANPDCSLCFSNAYCEENGVITKEVIPWAATSKVNESGIYDFRGIEELGYIPTASFFYRLEDRKRFPVIDARAFRGDGCTKLSLALQGYAYCLPECTCVYRFGVPGSVTTKWSEDNTVFEKYVKSYVLMYQEFDRITEGKYSDLMYRRILELEYQLWVRTNNYQELRKKKYREFSRNNGLRSSISHFARCYFPNLYRAIKGC